MFANGAVGRRQAPTPELRVGDEQAIERITRPPETGGVEKPVSSLRLVERPPIIVQHPLY